MCLILDTNKYGDFLNPENIDMQPVHDWMSKQNGKIVCSPTAKMKKELNRFPEMQAKFAEYRKAGKLKQIDKEEVNEAENELQGLQSNDGHIIALAIVANVKLLVSSDQALHDDFKNKNLAGGSIYQYETHRHLLNKDTCP